MSKVFTAIIVAGIVFAIFFGNISDLTNSITTSSAKAVENSIKLVSMMCFWSGIFKVLESTSFLNSISKVMSKIISKVFEKNSLTKEAEKYISLNIVSNILGIGNASTINGIKAMQELSKYSKNDIASNNMTRFVLINTASIQLFPTTMISLRTMYGSKYPARIIGPIIIISIIALTTAMIFMFFLNKVIKEE